MITARRLVRKKHTRTAFDGEGARISGGRFNSAGVRVVYAADALALSVLEISVHVPSYRSLRDRVAFRISIDERLVEEMSVEDLPADWRSIPLSRSTQLVGDNWARQKRSAVLQVPSVVVPYHVNFILNPEHPDFERIDIAEPEPIFIDPRLATS